MARAHGCSLGTSTRINEKHVPNELHGKIGFSEQSLQATTEAKPHNSQSELRLVRDLYQLAPSADPALRSGLRTPLAPSDMCWRAETAPLWRNNRCFSSVLSPPQPSPKGSLDLTVYHAFTGNQLQRPPVLLATAKSGTNQKLQAESNLESNREALRRDEARIGKATMVVEALVGLRVQLGPRTLSSTTART
jgi:hypothetical protein